MGIAVEDASVRDMILSFKNEFECSNNYQQKENLKKCLDTQHTNKKPHKKKVHTGKSLAQKSKGNPLGTVKCPQCSRVVKKKNLSSHLLTHTSDKPFECKECGKRFRRRTNLRVHMRCHTHERPYKCERCGESYKHASGLSYHLKNHPQR